MVEKKTRVALTIAGSDSGGGAGIQADLKAFARCGVHGTSAITALTAQNTVGVDAVETVSPAMIVAQVRAVQADLGVDAAKIGMLGTVETIEAVREALDLLGAAPVVCDPVMISESGAELLAADARSALAERILPRISVVTPNLPEARALSGLGEDADAEELARAVHALGSAAVVVTAGHGPDGADVFFDGSRLEHLPGPRHPDGAAHGSGCTHSASLAALLALGHEPLAAARIARLIAAEAVAAGLRDVGAGPGPVHVLGTALDVSPPTS